MSNVSAIGQVLFGNISLIGLPGSYSSVITAAIFGILATPFIKRPLPFVQLPRYVA